jgi:hypothetical protein
MKINKQTIFDNRTQTAYEIMSKQSAQNGTVLIYYFKKYHFGEPLEGTGPALMQLSQFFLDSLIKKGELQWI